MQAVQGAVHNSIKNLSGAPPAANGQPLGAGGQYHFPARTKEELMASMPQAASEGKTDPLATFSGLNDPAAEFGPTVELQPKDDGWNL